MNAAVRPRPQLFLLMTLLAVLALGWFAPPSMAAVSSATRCGVDVPYGVATPRGSERCFAPSTAYPQQIGWYAWVGRPGNCNNGPFARYFSELEQDSLMVCVMSPRYDAYALVRGSWVRRELTAGVAGYIHPFDATWRWVYVERQGWLAIRASDVGILWAP